MKNWLTSMSLMGTVPFCAEAVDEHNKKAKSIRSINTFFNEKHSPSFILQTSITNEKKHVIY